MLKLSLVRKSAYIYLTIPIVLFVFGWMRLTLALLITLILSVSILSLIRSSSISGDIHLIRRDLFWGILLIILWLFLSGIGGYSFQNWDHHSRNAVFRDLINYSWPVVYHLSPEEVLGYSSSSTLILSYYFGFWLPSALIGKVIGWHAAKFFLFLWSFVGLTLVILLVAKRTMLSIVKTTALIIFFSGIDAIGVLLLMNVPGYSYPLLWPPIQHLEWWAGALQYTSFTTELFWTFNQFIPTLLIMALLINEIDSHNAIFLVGICFFYAPIPALGAFPFSLTIVIRDAMAFYSKENGLRSLVSCFGKVLTIENISGVIIGIVSFLFYSTNLSAQTRELGLRVPMLLYIIFIFVEAGFVWILLLFEYRKDWMWYLAFLLLLVAPFIKLGGSWDFMMRFTIPALFILMIGCGRYLASSKSQLIKLVLLILLIFGSFTPLYEMGRSVVRFERYYQFPYLAGIKFDNYFRNPPRTEQLFVPEFDHLNTLIADDWGSVSHPNSEGWTTKVGNLFDSQYKWVWKQPLIYDDSQ